MNITDYDSKWFAGGFGKLRSLPRLIGLLCKYPRYVLIATDIQDSVNECAVEILWCQLNEAGVRVIIKRALQLAEGADDTLLRAKSFLETPRES